MHDELSGRAYIYSQNLKRNSANGDQDLQATWVSFTGRFSIKAAQADGKGLEGREWVAIIHGEDVFSNFSKL